MDLHLRSPAEACTIRRSTYADAVPALAPGAQCKPSSGVYYIILILTTADYPDLCALVWLQEIPYPDRTLPG